MINLARISGFEGGVDRYSRFYEFHSCALFHEQSHNELFAKIPYLSLVFKIVFFQSSTEIHDHRLGLEQKPI